MITSVSHFKGSIDLLNVEDSSLVPNGDELTNGNKLTDFVKEFETDVLVKCLGYSLYKEFSEQFEDGLLKEESEVKWKDLLNGKEYQVNGINYNWRGLLFKEGGYETSVTAYYIFSEYIVRDFIGVGIQSETIKNVKNNPDFVHQKAWNKFCDLVVYGGNGLSSLYQFIYDMNSLDTNTYKNWNGMGFEKINRLGV